MIIRGLAFSSQLTSSGGMHSLCCRTETPTFLLVVSWVHFQFLEADCGSLADSSPSASCFLPGQLECICLTSYPSPGGCEGNLQCNVTTSAIQHNLTEGVMVDYLITFSGPALTQMENYTGLYQRVGSGGLSWVLPATLVNRKTSSVHDKCGKEGKGVHIEEEDKIRFKSV